MSSLVVTLSAGATEAQIQSALNGLPDGGKLVLAANETIAIKSGLLMDMSTRSITLDLNGSTLQQAGDVTVLTAKGQHPAGQSAVLGHNGAGEVTITTANAPAAAVGQWVKVYSDSILPHDQGDTTRLGQAMEVVSVSGNTLTLKGDLLDQDVYAANIRVAKYVGGTPTIENGTIRGDQSHPTWVKDLVQVRSTVDADLNHLTVRDGNSMGINIVDSVRATVSQSAVINLTDDPTTGHNGYGVHSASSFATTVDGLYAERVRHATDDNAVGTAAGTVDPSKYGADIGMHVSDVVAYATSALAFSWHTEGRGGEVADSVVFNSHGVLGARGLGNAMRDVSGVGNGRGITFYEYGDGDGRDIAIDNVHLSGLTVYGYSTIGTAIANLISNSSFDVLSNKIWDSSGTTIFNTITNVVTAASQVSGAMTIGTADDDRLLGTTLADVIAGGDGDDYIWGGLGADALNGGAGHDRFAYLATEEGGDIISAFTPGLYGDAIDLSALAIRNGWKGSIFAGGYVALVQSGADTLLEVDADGGGNSFVTLATLKNIMATAVAGNISTQIHVTGGASSSSLTDAASVAMEPDPYAGALKLLTPGGTLTGTAASETLLGTAGNDRLVGGDGDDTLIGGAGGDSLIGGNGRNAVSYATAMSAITVDFEAAARNGGDAAGDVFGQIYNLNGSAFNDVLGGNASTNVITGDAGNDMIEGRAGADTLRGGSGDDGLLGGTESDSLFGDDGNDTLIGGTGYDKLTGGAGADSFIVDFADRNWDTITDFAVGDHIALTGFSVTEWARLSFVANASPAATAQMASLLYDTDDGYLYWDADGSGQGAAVKIALIGDHHALSASDFLFV